MKKILFLSILMSLGACTYKYTPTESKKISFENYEVKSYRNLKEGRSCMHMPFGLPLPGVNDTTVMTAMKNGNIKLVKSVDDEIFITPIYVRQCVVVRGE